MLPTHVDRLVSIDGARPFLINHPAGFDELDTPSSTFFGGHPEQLTLSLSQQAITSISYRGCIRGIVLNRRELRSSDVLASFGVDETDSCDQEVSCGASQPCINSGQCIASFDKVACQCPVEFIGNSCEIGLNFSCVDVLIIRCHVSYLLWER